MKKLRQVLACCLLGAFLSTASASTYPEASIRLLVPYSPGGGTDLMARLLGKEMALQLGVPVIVENRPGASGNIGTGAVARAKPDGYTLLLTSSGHTINPSLFKDLPFDPISDFSPVAQIAVGPSVLVVNQNSPYRDLNDFLTVESNAPERTFGSAGMGQPTHLAAASLAAATKIPVLHVPYSGSGDAELGLATGQVDFLVDSIPAALPFLTSKKTRALAVTGEHRFPLLPEVPTLMEQGLHDFLFTTWWGVLGPKNMPQERLELISEAIAKAMRSEELKRRFIDVGAEPEYKSSKVFGEFIKQELADYQALIEGLRITLN